jgi:hypothetical protein
MFRVPVSQTLPTFDETFKVSFWQWLTSGKAERVDWMRRRNVAVKVAANNQQAKIDKMIGRK